ncbi:MAG: hypothetical protein R2761_23860 [Acidimicrobiales bacterium]
MAFRPRTAALAAVLLVAAVSGCSNTDSAETGAARDTAAPFEPLPSGDLPLPPDARPEGRAVANGGTVSQSFVVEGKTPEQALNDYVTTLEDVGWDPLQGPTASGASGWRASMVRGNSTLQISSTQLGDNVGLSVQLTGA